MPAAKTDIRVKYAVVGLGSIAERAVLPGFLNSRKSRLISLVSGDSAKAKRLARKFGALRTYTYDRYAECLADPELEAVYIATPNALHVDHVIRAAAAGKHVLCEKPMANTEAECRQMIEAARQHSVRLMIAYRKYFEPASVALKRLVAGGRLGRLKLIHSAFSVYFAPQRMPATHWHFNAGLAGGGALPDVGVYCVNTVRWLTGQDPVEASAYAWSTDARFQEVEESIAFRLNFPEGLVFQATASFGAAQSAFVRLQGERGWASLDPAFAWNEERRLFGKIGGRWFEKIYPRMDEFALELDAFADCVRRGRDPEPDGEEGLKDVVVMEAIYRSAREGKVVPITIR